MEFSSTSNHMIMQNFEPNNEIFGLQGNMEMLGVLPSKTSNPNPNPWYADADFSMSRPNHQGLSLSLSNPNPSVEAVGFQYQQQLFMDQGSGRVYQFHQSQQQVPYQLKRSKYLVPAQGLLNEFCSLGGLESNSGAKRKEQNSSQLEEGRGSGSSSLYSMDLVELQKRKANLLSMLEEVYRRYRRYCEQMRAVVSSFEAVAGEGSARVYSALASKAMSRHFRCLSDGIRAQLQATKMAMGEKDVVTPGATKGETPRLKKLEQSLRQQKAFHHAGMMESQPWRPQRGLPERSVSILRAWLFEHFLHPYPSDVDKHILARQTGLSRSQVSNWFINARVRLWKPMVEDMYLEELREEENTSSNPNPNASSSQQNTELADQKPPSAHLFNDSGSLSSIINNQHHPNKEDNSTNISKNHNASLNFGVMGMDFPSYTGGGVSLTLGLQQHDGMSSFSSNSQHSLLFSQEHIDNGQTSQFSILDGEGQNLPYRNLMGAQLLHDLAG